MNASTNSSDAQWMLEDLVVEAVMNRPINCIHLASFVVLLFEYLITMDCEVRLTWGRKLSAARTIFLLNRYSSLLLYLLSLDPLLSANSVLGCEALIYMTQMVQVLLYAIWAAFSGLRIYAISNYNRVVTLAVVSLALIPVGTNVYLATKISAVFMPVINCIGTIDISEVTFDRLRLITRVCWTLSEVIVVVVTWMNTRRKGHSCPQVRSQMTLTELVLREGITYFGVLLLLNSLQVIFTFALTDESILTIALQLSTVFIPILISRFYFHLDGLQRQDCEATLPSALYYTPQFAARRHSTSGVDCSMLGDSPPTSVRGPGVGVYGPGRQR